MWWRLAEESSGYVYSDFRRGFASEYVHDGLVWFIYRFLSAREESAYVMNPEGRKLGWHLRRLFQRLRKCGCDVTPLYVRYDSFLCVRYEAFMCQTWGKQGLWDMTRPCAWGECAYVYETWLVCCEQRWLVYTFMRLDSCQTRFTCVTRFIHTYVRHGSFMCQKRLTCVKWLGQ